MKRTLPLLMLAGMVLGCSPAPPPVPPPPPPVVLAGWIAQASPWHSPEVPVAADLPVIAPQEFRGMYGMPATAGPPDPAADALRVIRQLAAHLDSTGHPVVPRGVAAEFVAALEGGHYVYNLGRAPDRPYHESNRVFMLSRGEQPGWTATRICHFASDWIGSTPGTVICAASHGSGAMLAAAVYRAGREVFRMEGVPGGDFRVEKTNADPPVLQMQFIKQWMSHKHDPYLIERLTLVWDGVTYELQKHERVNTGWPYHLARFLALVEAGRWERAAEHMAAAPPEGVRAYLDRVAPGLARPGAAEPGSADLPDGLWTTFGYFPPEYPRAYVTRNRSDWFWLAIAPDGRVQEVGRAVPPARP